MDDISEADVTGAEFVVLVNPDGHHCLWQARLQPPAGWRIVGPRGPRQTCLQWIEAQGAEVPMITRPPATPHS